MEGARAEVLGATRVRGADGRIAPVAGTLPRRLLAALALAGSEGRSAEGLAEDVWADEPPRNPRAALQMLVSRLRAGADGLIASTTTGYRLTRSDLADAEAAADDDLTAALDLWRGDPDVDGEVGDDLRHRSEGVRARLLERRATLLLAAGRHAEALADAGALQALRPLEGGPVLLRLRALEGLDRPAEALAAYAEHAALLADRLGADPDPALIAAHARLLRAVPATGPRLVGVRTGRDPLLGRDADLVAIDAGLRASRLVTVVGPGGMGKTRIAHETAARVAGRFGRVVFVELAGTRTAEDALLAVAEAAGARGARTTRFAADVVPDLAARTIDALGSARTLLVLDNCEHVVEAAAALADDLLASVPDLVVLATSRIPLLVTGERLHPLPPLATGTDAARLFVRRARDARPDVRLDDAAVVRVVGHLDGLPLAIELAAARLRSMTLDELEARLADRFALLVGGSRIAPERHRTLFAVIDWSWRLLPPDAQRAAALLGAFPDGFTAATAGDLLGRDAEPLLADLVDQSLLVFREEPRPRYRMLETVREFAVAALARAGLQEAAARGLDAAALAVVRRGPRLVDGPEDEALAALGAEEETLRAVLRVRPAGRERVVVAVFAALAEYWVVHGAFEAVLEALPLAFAATGRRGRDATEREELLRALVAAGVVAALRRLPEAVRTLALLRRALRALPDRAPGLWPAAARLVLQAGPVGPGSPLLDAFAASGEPVVATFGALTRSQLLENTGRTAEALVEAERAARLADRHGLAWLGLLAAGSVVQLHSQRGERAAALAAGEALEASDAARRIGTDLRQQDWLMGINLVGVGRLAEARARFERLVALPSTGQATEAEDVRVIALAGLAELAAAEGDRTARRRAWADAVAASRRASAPWTALIAAAAAADAAARGDREAAIEVYRRLRPRALALIRLVGPAVDRPIVASAALGLSAVLGGPLGARLAEAAIEAGVRLDLPALQGAFDAVARPGDRAADEGAAGDPVERIRALLLDPAARL